MLQEDNQILTVKVESLKETVKKLRANNLKGDNENSALRKELETMKLTVTKSKEENLEFQVEKSFHLSFHRNFKGAGNSTKSYSRDFYFVLTAKQLIESMSEEQQISTDKIKELQLQKEQIQV